MLKSVFKNYSRLLGKHLFCRISTSGCFCWLNENVKTYSNLYCNPVELNSMDRFWLKGHTYLNKPAAANCRFV